MNRLAAVMLVLSGCATAAPAPEGREVWSERVVLRQGETFTTDSRDLEIRPISVTASRAQMSVRAGGYEQNVEIGTGSIGSRTFWPYRIELLSTNMAPALEFARYGFGSVTLMVTRMVR